MPLSSIKAAVFCAKCGAVYWERRVACGEEKAAEAAGAGPGDRCLVRCACLAPLSRRGRQDRVARFRASSAGLGPLLPAWQEKEEEKEAKENDIAAEMQVLIVETIKPQEPVQLCTVLVSGAYFELFVGLIDDVLVLLLWTTLLELVVDAPVASSWPPVEVLLVIPRSGFH